MRAAGCWGAAPPRAVAPWRGVCSRGGGRSGCSPAAPACAAPAGSFAPQNVSNTLHGIVNIGIVPSVRPPAPPWSPRAARQPALLPLEPPGRSTSTAADPADLALLYAPAPGPSLCAAGAAERAGAGGGWHAAQLWGPGAHQPCVEPEPDAPLRGAIHTGCRRERGEGEGRGRGRGWLPALAGRWLQTCGCSEEAGRAGARPLCCSCCFPACPSSYSSSFPIGAGPADPHPG